MQLSVFQLLKNGTSFQSKPKESQIPSRKSSIDSNIQVFEKFNFSKFNPDDSTSEQFQKQDQHLNSRRKDSIDRIELEMIKTQNKQKQKISSLRKLYQIKCSGDNIPQLQSNFTKMMHTIDRALITNLKRTGFSKPTPIQMQAIPIILERRNLIAIAPTGSGKTAAFAIPILNQLNSQVDGGPRALIFAPTQELCSQLYNEFLKFRVQNNKSIRIKMLLRLIKKGANPDTIKEQWNRSDIMVCTPLKFLKMYKKIQFNMDVVEYFVMDESDKYFELGMLGQVQQIIKLSQNNPKLTYLLFSATIQEPVEKLFLEIMNDPIKLQIGGRNHVLKSIEQNLCYCSNEYGKLYELKNLINMGQFKPPILIFVQSKERAEQLHNEIQNLKINTQIRIDCIHGDKNTNERENIVKKFHSGDLWVLICTDLMSRGIDFAGVKLVINYDFPNSMLTYIHRVGRTGRAGMQGRSITFFTDEDKPLLRSFANVLKVSGCQVPEWIFKLKESSQITKKHNKKFPIRREQIDDAKAYSHHQIKKKVKI